MPDCSIVVCTCDAYSDVLAVFVALWRRYWPDCPFPLVLVAESSPDDAGAFARVFTNPRGATWCDMLAGALRELSTPYAMLLCNDYFLTAPVDTAAVCKRLEDCKRLGAASLRLVPVPPPARMRASQLPGEDALWRMRPQSAYCVATQAGFWRREYLLGLAERQKSAWEFERYGSFDPATAERPLLLASRAEFPYIDAVHKGCWEREGLRMCRECGVPTRRHLPTLRRRFIECAKAFAFALFPLDWILAIQNRFAIGAK